MITDAFNFTRNNNHLVAVFVLLLIALPASSYSSGVYVIKDDLETYNLTDHVLLFYDETGELTPNKISALPVNEFSSNIPFDQRLSGAFWGRLEIINLGGKKIKRVIKYCENSSAVATYFIDNEGVSSVIISGNFATLVKSKETDIRTFPILNLEHNESVIIIYRLYSNNTTSIIHPNELRLVSAKHFINSNTSETIFIGVLLGVLIIMLIFTITLFVILRDKNFKFFAWVLLAFLSYFLMIYQLPQRIFLLSGHFSFAIIGSSISIILLSFSALYSSFFELKSYYKFLHKLLWGLAIFFTLIFLLRLGFYPFFNVHGFEDIILLVWIVSQFAGITYLVIIKKPDAAMFFFSTLLLTIGSTSFLLTTMDLIPKTFIGTHGLQIGAIGFCTAIMITLWKRVKRIQIEQRKSQELNLTLAKKNEQLVVNQNIVLESEILKRTAELRQEKEASEKLLLNILPEEIAKELKENGEAEARSFNQVSILFTDFKEFTQLSEKLTAKALVAEINHCFMAFDRICEEYEIEKIKTIGDAYMASGGLPVPSEDSAKNIVLAAIQMTEFMLQRKKERETSGQLPFEMRAGAHTGPVVAGIVGVKKFQYDIWGDTVNTASRMESHGEVGRVNVSQTTYELLKNESQLTFEHRGKLEVKGKGEVNMYFVELA
jgi:class 3 adenylate cyclase